MDEIFIKKACSNVLKELEAIGFDESYKFNAQHKYTGAAYKIFNLKPYEANILKQECLSLGFDCAVNRGAVNNSCEKSDALVFADNAQYRKLILKLKNQPQRFKQLAEKLDAVISAYLEPITVQKRLFDWERPYIMGILNVTPDSFSDGGCFNDTEKAFSRCIKLIEDGADIIDIGGESTRPNAPAVKPEDEIKRVIPVIEKIRKNNIDIPISIDTRHYETAEAAIEAGADIINDVSGFDYDDKLFDYAAKSSIPSIIMHSNKVPASSSDFTGGDIIEEIYSALSRKIEKLIEAGMERKNIIIDAGIGFGKSKEGCFEILKRLPEFKSLNAPILLGISRKSFIRNAFNIDMEEADTVTALYSAMLKEVNIHRVHNVKLVKKFLDYAEFDKAVYAN